MELSTIENHTFKYVLTIHECGNISRAAKKLFITQPAMSKFLINLEKTLGFQIFNRSGRTLVPTSKGKLFLQYALAIYSLEQQLKRMVDEMQCLTNFPD